MENYGFQILILKLLYLIVCLSNWNKYNYYAKVVQNDLRDNIKIQQLIYKRRGGA